MDWMAGSRPAMTNWAERRQADALDGRVTPRHDELGRNVARPMDSMAWLKFASPAMTRRRESALIVDLFETARMARHGLRDAAFHFIGHEAQMHRPATLVF